MIEWYDFYIFGSLAVTIAPSSTLRATPRLPSLPIYLHSRSALSFVPLVSGRIGDLVGRKRAPSSRVMLEGGAVPVDFALRDNRNRRTNHSALDSHSSGTRAGR